MSYTSDSAYRRQYSAGYSKDSSADMPSYESLGQSAAARPQALSVSQAMDMAKTALERINITLIGEVSEVSDKPGYKACYFTVKDSRSSMPCLMWKNRYSQSGVVLQVGMKVLLTGRFTAYTAKGRMNFDVFHLELAGRGRLYAQIKATEDKLRREGLMSQARKRTIPMFPETIGVVTSPRGAAVHDVLRTLRRRFPLAHVLFAGVPVEGPQAPQNMILALKTLANAKVKPEVILLVRGGGSFEDLMPFNDEQLARTIAACPVPIITGIGHEPDNSIADEVADLRQSTPTGAAEAAVPDVSDLYQSLDSDLANMTQSVEGVIRDRTNAVDRVQKHPLFANPHNLFLAHEQKLDLAEKALKRDFPRNIAAMRDKTRNLGLRLASALPASTAHAQSRTNELQVRLDNTMRHYLSSKRMKLDSTSHVLGVAGKNIIDKGHQQIAMKAARLQDLSPLNILSRGYAITRDENSHIIHSVTNVSVGDKVDVCLNDGVMNCDVKSITHSEKEQ